MMTEDFTKLGVGSLVSGDRTIIRCPLCGRFGALDLKDDGLRRCVHVEASMIGKDGLWVDPRDLCEWPHSARRPGEDEAWGALAAG